LIGISNIFSDFAKNTTIREAVAHGLPDSVKAAGMFDARPDVLAV
jgi:hypothetical protein